MRWPGTDEGNTDRLHGQPSRGTGGGERRVRKRRKEGSFKERTYRIWVSDEGFLGTGTVRPRSVCPVPESSFTGRCTTRCPSLSPENSEILFG